MLMRTMVISVSVLARRKLSPEITIAQWVSKVLDLRTLAALPNLSELSRLEGQELLRPTVIERFS